MTDLIGKTFHWLKEQLPGRVSRPGNDRYVAATAIWATPVCRTPRAVVHCQTPEDVQSATQSKWNSSMPTNPEIVPRLLSFAAAAFVLLAVVNADAQPPAGDEFGRYSADSTGASPDLDLQWLAAHQPF
jgi:hypothetical protein